MAAGWGFFALIAYRAATMEIIEDTLWNPWDILGVSEVISLFLTFRVQKEELLRRLLEVLA